MTVSYLTMFFGMVAIAAMESGAANAQSVITTAPGIEAAMDTDQAVYQPGATVSLTVTKCNVSDHEIFIDLVQDWNDLEILREGNPVAFYQLGPCCGSSPGFFSVLAAPGECVVTSQRSWRQRTGGFPWPGDGAQVPEGRYTAEVGPFSADFEISREANAVPALSMAALSFLIALFALGGYALRRRLRI